jgi:phage-related protein
VYTLEFYEDEHGHEPVLDWLRRLTPRKRRAIGVAMFEILQHEGPLVVGTNFGKGLGGGIFEFRLDQDAAQVLARKGKRVRAEAAGPSKILLRVFCHVHGDRIILLVGGYDKGERPSARHQQAQIDLARTRLKAWKARQNAQSAD